ncbi:MAG TPA: shikimate dehydrogenase, partial [Actinomycetales bacterium]|nr:shikimate dehydrogenase [Actinomycetales bacterium]
MIRHRAAVLGDPVEHSLSPAIHNAGYAAAGLDDWEYGRFRCTAEDLPGIVGGADDSYAGFSVTMPGKFAALEFADAATDRAKAIGSANTLVRVDGGWRADNTDCDGVTGALRE